MPCLTILLCTEHGTGLTLAQVVCAITSKRPRASVTTSCCPLSLVLTMDSITSHDAIRAGSSHGRNECTSSAMLPSCTSIANQTHEPPSMINWTSQQGV